MSFRIFNREAAIRLTDTGYQNEVYKKATDHQKKFIYLPLHVFRTETNINQLVLKFEQNRGNQMNRTFLNEHILKIHKRLAHFNLWPTYLNGLKFLCEVTASNESLKKEKESSAENSPPIASTSRNDYRVQAKSNRKLRKRQVIIGIFTSDKIFSQHHFTLRSTIKCICQKMRKTNMMLLFKPREQKLQKTKRQQ